MTAQPLPDDPPLLALVARAEDAPLVIPLQLPRRNPALELRLAQKVSCLLIGDMLTCGAWQLMCVQSPGLNTFYILYFLGKPCNKVQAVSSNPAYRRQLYQRIGRRLVEFGWNERATLDRGGACWVSAWVTGRRLRKLA